MDALDHSHEPGRREQFMFDGFLAIVKRNCTAQQIGQLGGEFRSAAPHRFFSLNLD